MKIRQHNYPTTRRRSQEGPQIITRIPVVRPGMFVRIDLPGDPLHGARRVVHSLHTCLLAGQEGPCIWRVTLAPEMRSFDVGCVELALGRERRAA